MMALTVVGVVTLMRMPKFGLEVTMRSVKPLLARAVTALTGLVLVIGGTNVAGMLLARSAARRREIAVRLAIGASRARLARQLITESTVLFAAAGVLGALLARWVVVGLIGGSLAGFLITWERKGFGLLRNLVLGLAGALVGGLVFRMIGLLPALDRVTISLRDVVAAFIGSLLVLIALWLWQRASRPA